MENSNIEEKCRRIKIVLTDVDGVLTDGGMYYTKDGDVMKRFHARDGMGVTLLRKNDISTVIVTKETTEMVRKWSKKMNISKLCEGVQDKVSIVDELCKEYHVETDEMAYIGDDVNDIELLKKVGFSAVPADSINEVKEISDYICKTNSGQGVFREIVDLILAKK
jgi:3-deoxy-D-manno-octulosonate 8-phosphate phosphatase (KDO 8-P phosphatase)|tara:strand:- start:5899 stop:6393 length:495 start_codon:yes stop_codon:yes gene_type:complete